MGLAGAASDRLKLTTSHGASVAALSLLATDPEQVESCPTTAAQELLSSIMASPGHQWLGQLGVPGRLGPLPPAQKGLNPLLAAALQHRPPHPLPSAGATSFLCVPSTIPSSLLARLAKAATRKARFPSGNGPAGPTAVLPLSIQCTALCRVPARHRLRTGGDDAARGQYNTVEYLAEHELKPLMAQNA